MKTPDAPELTLPAKEFRFFDRAIIDTYGKSIGEIAQVEPAFAFKAMRIGLTALFTRQGHNRMVRQHRMDDGDSQTTAVVDRNLDGEAAYTGATSHAMGDIVDELVARYESSEANFVISVVRNPNFIGRMFNKEPVKEVVAVIPHMAE